MRASERAPLAFLSLSVVKLMEIADGTGGDGLALLLVWSTTNGAMVLPKRCSWLTSAPVNSTPHTPSTQLSS